MRCSECEPEGLQFKGPFLPPPLLLFSFNSFDDLSDPSINHNRVSVKPMIIVTFKSN